MDYSEIKIKLEGVKFDRAERYRVIIHKLIMSGAFDVQTGQTVINWNGGKLMDAKINLTVYKACNDLDKEV